MICAIATPKHPEGRTGTSAGYQAHRAAGEKPCDACREGSLAAGRARWAVMSAHDLEVRRLKNREEQERRRLNNPEAMWFEKHTYMAKNRSIIRAAKDQPCADCGVHYPYYVMQFDHTGSDKRFNIGQTGPTSKRSILLDEITKCDVVCANCHAVRTHARALARRSA